MTRFILCLFCLLVTAAHIEAQEMIIPVADQTFKMDGKHEFVYAFAEGDQVVLQVQEITGREIKSIEFLQHPDHLIFRAYELDSVLTQTLQIARTGVYLLRFQETGLSKKICRFILKRSPASRETARFETRVGWDIGQFGDYRVGKRSVQVGKKTETVPTSGQVHVGASKFYLKKPVNAWQFTLPPNTVQWAYRIAVGQNGQVARQEDAQKLTRALQTGGAKLLGTLPETALAAFALGMAIDMTVSKGGEDVEYALVDYDNWVQFSKSLDYQSFMYQGAVSVDVQRRYAPLAGTYYFALRSDNWVDDIDVTIDIEAVVETPIFETEIFLEPLRP